ncbi:LPS export ABC transporter periplasmic protein LptC [Gammaproteobacteria bacterium]|nr:LPS export ABC transporter periplasmic protein LptC [Gammaproteobacteria bacterium]|tara:strand:- start:1664 stop:2248 length:585 start_codon:yes stop_codon:yes gene_type:complete
MYKSTILFIPIVIAITLLSTIFSGGSLSDLIANKPRVAEIELEYESLSEGMNTIQFNDDGTINYTLRAETQIQFTDNHLEVEKPFIKLFQNGESRWNIVADKGTISDYDQAEQKILVLSGDVEIFGLDERGNITKMFTEYLEIDPNNETLETNRSIRLIAPNLQQSSEGMFTNLKADEIIFHDEIRGFYENEHN